MFWFKRKKIQISSETLDENQLYTKLYYWIVGEGIIDEIPAYVYVYGKNKNKYFHLKSVIYSIFLFVDLKNIYISFDSSLSREYLRVSECDFLFLAVIHYTEFK